MDRGGLLRWLLLGVGIFMLFTVFKPFGGGAYKPQPLLPESQVEPAQRKPKQYCDLWSHEYHARLSTQGAAIERYELLTAKYRHQGKPTNLITTPDYAKYRPMTLHFRNEAAAPKDAADWQVAYDSLDWTLVTSSAKSCEFQYRDEKVELTKTVKVTNDPYELSVQATIKNLAPRPLVHALSVSSADWRTSAEVKGHLFRVSPFITHVECISAKAEATRLQPDKFDADDFAEREHFPVNQLNRGDWYQVPSPVDVAAISNAYFTNAIAHVPGPGRPVPACQARTEERWHSDKFSSPHDDPESGAIYRARLTYPLVTLAPGEAKSYSALAYIGPKERKALAEAGHNLSEVLDLGFFSAIAKVLVGFLLKVHSIIPNWGIAIIVLTITARVLLFPLSVPSIRSMMKMRELKPEIDALNEKYKDDPQAKGLAQMELWRKHKVNPLKGCLPQLASMPVWFALYTTLQTAVELYHIPFLWFPDLSQPDHFYVLPLVIGATYFVQQKLMPMQADPAQQKMMLYFMPAMFTVFMLFLPAGLGVYMFTNSVLGILQQQAVEWHARRSAARGSGGIQVEFKGESPDSKKGQSKDDPNAKLSGGALFGKGKA
jgi:YidC/Oxa1 family membrane protein insertase